MNNNVDLKSFISKLKDNNITIQENLSGKDLCTYRVGGIIDFAVYISNTREVEVIAEIIRKDFAGLLNNTNVVSLGRGSNVLISDEGFSGVAFFADGELLEIDINETTVKAGSGVSLPVLSRQCASNCVGGLEFYVGIPGSVGGAVAMNAGGHNCQTSDVLRSTNCLSLETGDFVNFDKDLCNFDYRKSRFTNSDFIVDATFEGFKRDEETIKERLDEIVKWRRENQPGGRNVGSVFQNPADCSAGELIEKAGLKGFSIGGAQVSEKHANFIQAAQDAKAQDIYDLIGHVKKHIFETTGYDLKTEVRYIGNYGK